MYLNPVPKSAIPVLPLNDKGNYLPISPVVFGLVILALLVVTTVVKIVSGSDNGSKIQQRRLAKKKKNSKISEQRSMKEGRSSHTQERSSVISRKSSEGDSGKSTMVVTSSRNSCILSDEEEPPTCWNKMRGLLCPWRLPHRIPSVKTVPSIDALSDEFEYVVEKLVIKKVPLSLCGTKEDYRQRYDERSHLASLSRASSVPKAMTETERIGNSMHSSDSELGNIVQELSPVAHTSKYTKTKVPSDNFYENQVGNEENVIQKKSGSNFSNSPAQNNYNSDIPLPVVQPLVHQNAPYTTMFPTWVGTTSSHESKSNQGTPQSERSIYCGLNSYYAPMADSVLTKTEHAAGPWFKHNAPKKSIGHDGKYRAKPGQHTNDDYLSRAQKEYSKCFDVNDSSEMSSTKHPSPISHFQDPDNLSIKSKNEVDYPMQPHDSKSDETVENESLSNPSSSSDTSSINTSKSFTPEQLMSTSNKSFSSIKGSDILYAEEKQLAYSDEDEENPVYVSVDGKRVFKTEEEAKHDFLNQFTSMFVDNLKDPIPKDPETLPKKDRRSQQTSVRDNKSRISLPELLSEIGSTQVKSVPTGARKGGIFTNKSKPDVAQYVLGIQTDRSTSGNHGIITEDLQSSEMLCAPLNTFSPATSAGFAHSDLVQVVEIQLGPDKPSGTTVISSSPQTQGTFKTPIRQDSIKGHPNEATPSSHMASDTLTTYSMTSSIIKKQTNIDPIPSNEAEPCKKQTVSFIGLTPTTVEDETKQIESPGITCYNIKQNLPIMISQTTNESKEESDLFSPTTSEYVERLHEYPSAISVNESQSSSDQPDAEIVISPQSVQLIGSACLLDFNDSSISVDGDHACPLVAMPQNPCGISSVGDAFEVESDHSREQELDKSPVHVPPQRLHTFQLGHTSGAPSADIPATGTEYHPIAAGAQTGRNRLRSNALGTSSRTTIGYRTQQDLSANTRDPAERGATLRWKIIIKHHRDAPEEQSPKNKNKDILPSNDAEL